MKTCGFRNGFVVGCGLLAATMVFFTIPVSAALFNVNDPLAGLGSLTIPATVEPPESIFQWPYMPGPFIAPMTAAGQFQNGDLWSRAEVFFVSHMVEGAPGGGPNGQGFHLSFTVWGNSGWTREELFYTIWDGSTSTVDPQITVTTSSGFTSQFIPSILPPADNSDDDLTFLLARTSQMAVPEPLTWTVSLLGVCFLLLPRLRQHKGSQQ